MFKFIYKLLGWKVTHYLPNDIIKCVIIVAPHTSNWDFIYGIGTVQTMKLKQQFIIKKEWMRFPFNLIMGPLGAVPIDRNKKTRMGKKQARLMQWPIYLQNTMNCVW
jgi:1-acyl-sn-glycerol-3-phosphate acyltransferase